MGLGGVGGFSFSLASWLSVLSLDFTGFFFVVLPILASFIRFGRGWILCEPASVLFRFLDSAAFNISSFLQLSGIRIVTWAFPFACCVDDVWNENVACVRFPTSNDQFYGPDILIMHSVSLMKIRSPAERKAIDHRDRSKWISWKDRESGTSEHVH